MGLEAVCKVRRGRKTDQGRAFLESTEIVFRGAARLSIPLASVTGLEVVGGDLVVTWPEGKAAFALGAAAEAWAQKIRRPRSLMDKLGVKAGSRVSVLNVVEEPILADLRERARDLTVGKTAPGSDVILVRVSEKADLLRIPALKKAMKENGALWVLWPKGRKELREDDVRGAALAGGLVDVKVASVSDVLSGLKLVIPVAQRSKKT